MQPALDHQRCQRRYDWSFSNTETSCEGACGACLDALPDSVFQQHLLPRLSAEDKRTFRLTAPRQRQLINQSVYTVRVAADVLEQCPPGTRLGAPFPAARTLQASDSGESCITDGKLIKFLAQSGPWLESLLEVNLKRCLEVTPGLLVFLRAHCRSLKKLAPSKWTDDAALREIAAFHTLEELDLGDLTRVVTINDLGLSSLQGLAGSLRSLSLCHCVWVTDAVFGTVSSLAKLEVLDLSYTAVGPMGLAWLAELPVLHTLNLTECRLVTDEALEQVARVSSLTSLILKATSATNAGLQHLVSLPRLSHLDLGRNWELNDIGLAAVAACPELKVLNAGSFNLVRPNMGNNPKGLQKLEHLSFGGGFAHIGLHLLFPLLRLKSLHIHGIGSVTDCVMRHVSASQTQLQHLSLRNGYSLTAEGLKLLTPLANLAVLSIGACPGVSRAALEAFTVAHARLTMIKEGCCPLLADPGDVLCALAAEPAITPGFAACVKVN